MIEDYKTGWQQCLDIIRGDIGESRFQTWFACARPVGFVDNTLTINLPSQFHFEQYEDTFYGVLANTLRRVFGPAVRLRYEIGAPAAQRPSSPSSALNPSSINSSAISSASVPPASLTSSATLRQPRATAGGAGFDSQLNPMLNFENYIVGDSNRLPYAIAEHVSRNPVKKDFNPFFLYGSVGVGKTHLIQAIGLRIKEHDPQAKVLFTSSRQFQNLYANAVMQKRVPGFINWFQQMDVLLIDDLQELAGKGKTSDALFPIFNHLHLNGKQLVFTCDRPPQDLDGIADRLIDRFKWGVTEELPRPDFSLRKQILLRKAIKNGLTLPEDVLDAVAECATTSVRELEGIVMGILTRSITKSVPVTVGLARDVMRNSVKMVERKPMNLDMIVEAASEYYNLNPDVIYSKSRVRDIADARQVIMYLAHTLTGLSSTAIGSKLNRKHATVLHGIATVRDRLSVSRELSEAVSAITTSLNA